MWVRTDPARVITSPLTMYVITARLIGVGRPLRTAQGSGNHWPLVSFRGITSATNNRNRLIGK